MHALLLIDLQNDFCAGGSLTVPDGDAVVPVVNALADRFDHVLQTQDWHPAGHHSFASTHPGKQPFDTIELPYGTQVLWPDHCVQSSEGAAFHPGLRIKKTELIIRKGFHPEIDSYSAFFENDQETPTGLAGYLRERGIDQLFLAGLATDFCVRWSALDGRRQGFDIAVIADAVRGIDLNGSVADAFSAMQAAGVRIVSSADVPRR